jgi:hypothetical protein
MPGTFPPGSFSADQFVTNPSGLIQAMNNFSGTGARIVLAPGQAYVADFTQLAGATIYLTIEGSARGSDTGSTASVIQVTGVNASNVNPLQYITFRRLTFTTKGSTLTGSQSWIYGSSNLHLMFEDCEFIDFVPTLVLNSGDDIRFYRCKITQSGSPPTHMNPNILGPGGLLIVKDCIVDWNVHGKFTGTRDVALAGFAGYSDASPGPWWILDNQILPSGRFSADAAIDIESKGTTFAHCWIERNLIRNSKIWLVSGDDVWIRRNVHIIDSNYVGVSPGNAYFIISSNANTAPPALGEVHVEENLIVDLTTAPGPLYARTKLALARDAYVRALYLDRNQFYYSTWPTGPGTWGDLGIIELINTSNNAAGWGFLSICDNRFGCVSIGDPGNILPAIHLEAQGGPWDRVLIRGNRGVGVSPTSGVVPATVAHGISGLLSLGATGSTLMISDLTVEDNDLGNAATAGTIAWLSSSGPTSIARSQFRKNFPRESNDLVTISVTPFTYVHGSTALAGFGAPATGPANVSLLGGVTVGGGLILNGVVILGPGLPIAVNLQLMIGDVLIVNWGTAPPTLRVDPSSGTL